MFLLSLSLSLYQTSSPPYILSFYLPGLAYSPFSVAFFFLLVVFRLYIDLTPVEIVSLNRKSRHKVILFVT